jgi:hypothetical protein
VDSRVVVRIREFLIGRSQRVRFGEGLILRGSLGDVSCTSRECSGPTSVPSLIFYSMFLHISFWRNTESKIRLYADDCILYRKILDVNDIEILQTNLDRLIDWGSG